VCPASQWRKPAEQYALCCWVFPTRSSNQMSVPIKHRQGRASPNLRQNRGPNARTSAGERGAAGLAVQGDSRYTQGEHPRVSRLPWWPGTGSLEPYRYSCYSEHSVSGLAFLPFLIPEDVCPSRCAYWRCPKNQGSSTRCAKRQYTRRAAVVFCCLFARTRVSVSKQHTKLSDEVVYTQSIDMFSFLIHTHCYSIKWLVKVSSPSM